MKYHRHLVYLVFLVSSILSYFGGRAVYQFVLEKRLLAEKPTHVTEIKSGNSVQVFMMGFKHFYELRPDQEWTDTTAWLGLNPTYRINSDGFNSLKNYTQQIPQDIFRIMTIGDSFTFGQFVDTADNFSERLANMLQSTSCGEKKSYEVINLGVPGYDIGYTVAHFRNKGVNYHPNLIIWLINTHNVISRDYIISRLKETKVNIPDGIHQKQESASAFYGPWLKAQEDVIRMVGKEALIDIQRGFIEEFMNVYTGPLVVVHHNLDDPDYLSFIQSAFGIRGRTVIDYSFPDLQGATFEDAHPNVKGHTLIATHMYKLIQEHKEMLCS